VDQQQTPALQVRFIALPDQRAQQGARARRVAARQCCLGLQRAAEVGELTRQPGRMGRAASLDRTPVAQPMQQFEPRPLPDEPLAAVGSGGRLLRVDDAQRQARGAGRAQRGELGGDGACRGVRQAEQGGERRAQAGIAPASADGGNPVTGRLESGETGGLPGRRQWRGAARNQIFSLIRADLPRRSRR
jgi:hypothetical protein